MIERLRRGLKHRVKGLPGNLQGPRLERNIGGELSFWRGALVPGDHRSGTMLSRLKPEGRREAFPEEIFWVLGKMDALNAAPFLRILGVGFGRFPTLAHLLEQGRAKVCAEDPLAAEHLKLIRDRGYVFPVLPEPVVAQPCPVAAVQTRVNHHSRLYGQPAFVPADEKLP